MKAKDMDLVKHICLDAILMAMYYIISLFSIIIPPGIHISFAGLVLIVVAIYVNPIDALIVALGGEFIAQLYTWGLTPTTLLWMVLPMVRILILWPFIKLLKEPLDKNHILYWTAVILSSLILTVTNAGAEVLDGLIIGYPTTYIVGVIG